MMSLRCEKEGISQGGDISNFMAAKVPSPRLACLSSAHILCMEINRA